jgi:hypothetical protein
VHVRYTFEVKMVIYAKVMDKLLIKGVGRSIRSHPEAIRERLHVLWLACRSGTGLPHV